MQINPGDLRQKIEIYSKTITVNANGYETETPVLFHSCSAKFTRTSGTELQKANADFADVKVRFLIRYTSKAISRKMTVKYGGNTYQITYINDYEDRHEYIEIWAELLTAAG